MSTTSTFTTPSPNGAAPASSEPVPLSIDHILASGLPPELATAAEPPLYTVPVVFSRRVTPQERAVIEDPATAAHLMDVCGAGPDLRLTVSDRRLLIDNTTLAQLDGVLAAAIGAMLTTLGDQLHAAREERTAAAEASTRAERERAEGVARTAAGIRFGPAEERDGGAP